MLLRKKAGEDGFAADPFKDATRRGARSLIQMFVGIPFFCRQVVQRQFEFI